MAENLTEAKERDAVPEPAGEEALKTEASQPGPLRSAVLITGASRGFGREFAILAAQSGLLPVLVARNEEDLKSVADEVRTRFGMEAVVFPTDLSDSEAPRILEDFLDSEGIAVNALINNAGFGAFGPVLDIDLGRAREMIDLNIGAVMELSIRFGRRMAEAGHGRIMNVASIAAFQACPWMGLYGATKSFVLTFSEALSEELAHSGVTVTALCPGPAQTDFGRAAGLKAENPFGDLSTGALAVAEFGWKAMLEGRPVAVEGSRNLLCVILAKFLPRCLVRRVAGGFLKKMK